MSIDYAATLVNESIDQEQTFDNDCRLTTFDNPFNPFDDFINWHLYDKEMNYNSLEYLDRIADYEDDMTQKEIYNERERAIDSIIKHDPLNIYKKVWRDTANEV